MMDMLTDIHDISYIYYLYIVCRGYYYELTVNQLLLVSDKFSQGL